MGQLCIVPPPTPGAVRHLQSPLSLPCPGLLALGLRWGAPQPRWSPAAALPCGPQLLTLDGLSHTPAPNTIGSGEDPAIRGHSPV